ncbi:MAG: ABC transporter substrate-binding protein [Burkholderiaceae bacterium]
MAATFATVTDVAAQATEVPVAVVAPLSGPWARAGQMMRQGAELAVDDINASGGIKSMGGAKLRLIVADAGDTPEKARNAAQRLQSEHPQLAGGIGAWLSSFTLAITEITERAGIPWLANSFSDQLTDRGFRYVFQTGPTGTRLAQVSLPTVVEMATSAFGKAPQSIGVITENTAAPLSILKSMREGGFARHGLKVSLDEVYTPPLSDATSLVQKVRASRPDLLLMFATGIQDNKLLIEKLNEFGLGKGRMPVVVLGAQAASPEFLRLIGKDLTEGVMALFAVWPTKEHAELVDRFKARFKEPWMSQDPMWTYGDVWLLKDAIEIAGSGDRERVAAALRTMDLGKGAAAYYTGRRVRFDDKGRRLDAGAVIIQWQDGLPVLVYPPDQAVAKARWQR